MKNIKKPISLLLSLSLLGVLPASVCAQEAISVIMSTGTTQAFASEPIDEADLTTILEAGLAASSAINSQPWYFAVITNSDVMEEITASLNMGGAPQAHPEGELPADSDALSVEEAPAVPEGETPPETPADAEMPTEGEAPVMPASGSAKAGLGDSPVAIVIYMDENSASPNASFDCGLACQNMVIAAASLGYGTKIISSPTMALNGENHDALCEALGVDSSLTAAAVLLIGYADTEADVSSSASTRSLLEEKASFIQ